MAAFFYARRSRHRRRGFIAYGSIILNALALLLFVLFHSTFELMLLMAISNGAVMIFMLIWEGSLQELIPSESYGRVSSLDLFGIKGACMYMQLQILGLLNKRGSLATDNASFQGEITSYVQSTSWSDTSYEKDLANSDYICWSNISDPCFCSDCD